MFVFEHIRILPGQHGQVIVVEFQHDAHASFGRTVGFFPALHKQAPHGEGEEHVTEYLPHLDQPVFIHPAFDLRVRQFFDVRDHIGIEAYHIRQAHAAYG